MTRKIVNIDNWNRKEQFLLFRNCESPFYGITANVDCTETYKRSKSDGRSFFLYYLHATLKSVNSIENFRMRFDGDDLVVYDTIHNSSTIGKPDGTFGFSFFEYHEDLKDFLNRAEPEVERVKRSPGLAQTEDTGRIDMIHCSAIPWISFTGVVPERHSKAGASIPKIYFGKYFKDGETLQLPISVHANHALVDGIHMGLFFEELQNNLKA